jgi:hypothetical protein
VGGCSVEVVCQAGVVECVSMELSIGGLLNVIAAPKDSQECLFVSSEPCVWWRHAFVGMLRGGGVMGSCDGVVGCASMELSIEDLLHVIGVCVCVCVCVCVSVILTQPILLSPSNQINTLASPSMDSQECLFVFNSKRKEFNQPISSKYTIKSAVRSA